jgi:hypothetical protein
LGTVQGRVGAVAGQDVDCIPYGNRHDPPDILTVLKRDRTTWKHFQAFPESYKRIRIGWIEAARRRPEILRQRLRHFLKMTAQNKRFGMVQ